MAGRKGLSGGPGAARAVERQLSNWELARAQRLTGPVERGANELDFICLSRMVGIDGREVAVPLARRLGWPLFDREVLDRMAGDDEVRRQIYRAMDEHDFKWWEAAMSPWVVGRFVLDDYFRRLGEAVLGLARQSRCIFLGRGADLILPQGRGLRVRMVASLSTRIQSMAASRARTEAEARVAIEAEEHARLEYFRRHFHASPDDLLRHDLVVNLDRLSAAEVVDLVVAAHRHRAAPLAAGAAQ